MDAWVIFPKLKENRDDQKHTLFTCFNDKKLVLGREFAKTPITKLFCVNMHHHTACCFRSSAYFGPLTHRSQVSLFLCQIPRSTDSSLWFPIKHEHAWAAPLFIVGLQIGTRAHPKSAFGPFRSKEAFADFLGPLAKGSAQMQQNPSVLRQNSTKSPSPIQSCQRFGGALKKKRKRRRRKWFKSIRKGLFILWEAPLVWSGVGLCSDCCKESDEPVNQEEGWHHCSAPYLWAELLRRAMPLLCWSV